MKKLTINEVDDSAIAVNLKTAEDKLVSMQTVHKTTDYIIKDAEFVARHIPYYYDETVVGKEVDIPDLN